MLTSEITSSLSRNSSLSLLLIRILYEWLHHCIGFIELLLSSLLRNWFLKWIYCVKLAHRFIIKVVDTLESFFTNSLLMISKEETSELLSLEKVLAVILRFCHSKDLDSLRSLVLFWLNIGSHKTNILLCIINSFIVGCMIINTWSWRKSRWTLSLLLCQERSTCRRRSKFTLIKPKTHFLLLLLTIDLTVLNFREPIKWIIPICRIIIWLPTLTELVFNSYSFGKHQSLIVFEFELVSTFLSFTLYCWKLRVVIFFFAKDAFEEIVAGSFIHGEDSVSDNGVDWSSGSMVEEIPILVV